MKIIKIAAIVITLSIAGVLIFINTVNNYQDSGTISIEGLHAGVKIVRDEKGMAYVYADDLHDAIMAQGFITAQDRLFQMELTRMFAQGRICELAGEKAKALDIRMRTLGFHRNAKKHAAILNEKSRKFFQAYADGVNQYLEKQADYHHVEFKLAGIKPSKWEIEDIFSILYYMGWDSAANMQTELLAQMLIEKLGYEKAREIFPININPEDPEQFPYNPHANHINFSDISADLPEQFSAKGTTDFNIADLNILEFSKKIFPV